ncbi:hydroxyisourate hydrolase [Paenibacillus albicereus]|uniref:Hydroxyisourate hydrolase n=1 Tax=Paenibacillus albicereus TaxID=2726185 RepID=A0A6H2GV13_9BACL|nr:hydroxyisourate hydrolase [Paenibacillus albicereus]QJC51264.1 hydroxyisourate hydrolase [Paenibacillus albicereus]
MKLLRGREGSIVLEAALVVPVFLLLLVLLSVFLQLSAAETALQRAADASARQIAAHMRPALLLQQEAAAAIGAANPSGLDAALPGWREAAAAAAGRLPEPAGPLAESVLRGEWKPALQAAADTAAKKALEPLLLREAEAAGLEKEHVRLTAVRLPDLDTREQGFLLLEAEYSFPIRVPFTNERIVLRRWAKERAWIPDAAAATGREQAEPGEGSVRIASLTPVPARPGKKATLTAVAAPGVQVTLEVRYKSGSSVSRHVGTKTADSLGRVDWTWLVSGNTTPGVWEVIVTSSDGGSATMPFHVKKKP